MKFFSFTLSSLFILLISSFTSWGQSKYQWKTAKSGSYVYKYVTNDPSNSRYYTLKNGLTVILSPSKLKPRIQTYIAVKAGSKTDPSDHTGLAHYLEHMLFKGTQKYGSLDWNKEKPLLEQIETLYEKYNQTNDETKRTEIYAQIDKVSGEAAKFAIANEYDKMMTAMGAEGTNAFTSFEQTVYTEDIPSNNIDKFLAVQSERFKSPVFRIFHTELEAVYEEKNRGLDNDGRKVFEAMFAQMFPNNNYGKQTTIGTIEHLKNPSLKAIRKYFDTYYVPNNMGIIMAGDFNPDQVIAKIDKAFAYMKSKPIPPYTFEPEKPIQQPIIKKVIGPNPENIMIGFRFPGAASQDAQMLNLVSNILTNGSAGLIDLNLVQQQKLLTAAAFPYILKDYSILILSGSPSQGQNLDQVKTLILGEIEKLKNGDFSQSLLTSIINNNKVDLIKSMEDYDKVGSSLMENFTSGTDWLEQLNYIDFISKLTKKDIVAFANKYFNDHNYVAILKEKGEDKNIVKVDKPKITPVSVNRDAQSAFLKTVNAMPEVAIQPLWIDYKKDIQRGKVNQSEIMAVPNTTNDLFELRLKFDGGKWNQLTLPIALEYLQYLGTKDKSSAQISQEKYLLASNFNIAAGNEESALYISGLNENLGKTFAMVQDLLTNCVADENSFKAYIAKIKKSRNDAKANKTAIAKGLSNYARFGSSNPFNYTLTDAQIDALKAEDLVQILHELMNYKFQVLYYGPSSVSELANTIAPLLPKNSGTKDFPAAKIFKTQPTDASKVLFAQYDMVQAEVYWTRNASTYDAKQVPTIDLFNNYFGGGMGSIVFQTIRESKALAYSTYAYYTNADKKDRNNQVTAYVGTQADKFKEAVLAMNELLNDMPRSDKAFEGAKTSLIKTLASERITKIDIIENYLYNQKLGNTTDIRKTIFEHTSKLTFDNIKSFQESEIAKKPYVLYIVSNENKINMEDVKNIGEFKKLSLEELFGY